MADNTNIAQEAVWDGFLENATCPFPRAGLELGAVGFSAGGLGLLGSISDESAKL